MKISKKIAIAAIPAVMAMASTNVDSKILLMSQEGWEVSFDGAANAFIMQNSGTNAPTTSGGNVVAFDTLLVSLMLLIQRQVLLQVFYQMFGV